MCNSFRHHDFVLLGTVPPIRTSASDSPPAAEAPAPLAPARHLSGGPGPVAHSPAGGRSPAELHWAPAWERAVRPDAGWKPHVPWSRAASRGSSRPEHPAAQPDGTTRSRCASTPPYPLGRRRGRSAPALQLSQRSCRHPAPPLSSAGRPFEAVPGNVRCSPDLPVLSPWLACPESQFLCHSPVNPFCW